MASRLERELGPYSHCGGCGKVVVVHTEPEFGSLERGDRICGLAEADAVPGRLGCGKRREEVP